MRRGHWWAFSIMTLLAVMAAQLAAQTRPDKGKRAKPPKFDDNKVSRAFFKDIFEVLDGPRPADLNKPATPIVQQTPNDPGGGDGQTGSKGWSKIISAASIEDEIKELKLKLDATVTTPAAFAGLGHEEARRQFSLLTLLFAIIEEYDGDVRWKESAPLARERFARAAANTQAGGNIQVYNEAKLRKQDLDELVRGSDLDGTAGEREDDWSGLLDRTPLMELLSERFEGNLKSWTVDESTFKQNAELALREAELVAAISQALIQEGMDEADDEAYQQYALLMKSGGDKVAQGVRQNSLDLAKQGVVTMSKVCDTCHDIYR